MKSKDFYLFIIAIGIFFSAFSQQFQGIATYKTDRKIDLKMDSTSVNAEMQQQIQAQLRKQFQKEYTLSFNTSESVYKEEESLAAPSPATTGGINIVISGNSDILYRNIKTQEYSNQTEIMGKVFLIKDSLTKKDWKLEKETKNIGEYTCFKATLTEEVTEQTFNSNHDDLEKVTKKRVTTAWYTPQIPVSNGPGEYWGLPGLILEINDGEQSILCSKIVLNPTKISIEAPDKGKVVTQEEFDAIKEKKNQELMENLEDNHSKKDGNSFRIKIGG
ncbi:MAG: GLPGLI family protein [Aequorivita sp.]|nr:GLPGLI family protein [Aequorivita sp.]